MQKRNYVENEKTYANTELQKDSENSNDILQFLLDSGKISMEDGGRRSLIHRRKKVGARSLNPIWKTFSRFFMIITVKGNTRRIESRSHWRPSIRSGWTTSPSIPKLQPTSPGLIPTGRPTMSGRRSLRSRLKNWIS